jgi:hypothetical protein
MANLDEDDFCYWRERDTERYEEPAPYDDWCVPLKGFNVPSFKHFDLSSIALGGTIGTGIFLSAGSVRKTFRYTQKFLIYPLLH